MSHRHVNFFGMDALGHPVGLKPWMGATIGAAIGTGTAIGLRRWAQANAHPKTAALAELYGLGAVAVPSIVGMFFPHKTRAASWAALSAAIVNNGARAVDQYFAAKDTGTFGMMSIESVRRAGLGQIAVNGSLNARGLPGAVASAEIRGGLGAAGGGVTVLRGAEPPVSVMGGIYGATVTEPSA